MAAVAEGLMSSRTTVPEQLVGEAQHEDAKDSEDILGLSVHNSILEQEQNAAHARLRCRLQVHIKKAQKKKKKNGIGDIGKPTKRGARKSAKIGKMEKNRQTGHDENWTKGQTGQLEK